MERLFETYLSQESRVRFIEAVSFLKCRLLEISLEIWVWYFSYAFLKFIRDRSSSSSLLDLDDKVRLLKLDRKLYKDCLSSSTDSLFLCERALFNFDLRAFEREFGQRILSLKGHDRR